MWLGGTVRVFENISRTNDGKERKDRQYCLFACPRTVNTVRTRFRRVCGTNYSVCHPRIIRSHRQQSSLSVSCPVSCPRIRGPQTRSRWKPAPSGCQPGWTCCVLAGLVDCSTSRVSSAPRISQSWTAPTECASPRQPTSAEESPGQEVLPVLWR